MVCAILDEEEIRRELCYEDCVLCTQYCSCRAGSGSTRRCFTEALKDVKDDPPCETLSNRSVCVSFLLGGFCLLHIVTVSGEARCVLYALHGDVPFRGIPL